MSKQGIKLSEQLSAVESKCNSLNVIKHVWGWEEYIAPLLMLVTDGLGRGGLKVMAGSKATVMRVSPYF